MNFAYFLGFMPHPGWKCCSVFYRLGRNAGRASILHKILFYWNFAWSPLAFEFLQTFSALDLVVICHIRFLDSEIRNGVNIGKLLAWIIKLLVAKVGGTHKHLVLIRLLVFIFDIWGHGSNLPRLISSIVKAILVLNINFIIFLINDLSICLDNFIVSKFWGGVIIFDELRHRVRSLRTHWSLLLFSIIARP